MIKFGIARGIMMNIDPQTKTQRIYGIDEREISSYVEKFSKQCQSFIDIGASDGYYGLIYRKFNPNGQIHLFDAGELFLAEQKINFEMNGFAIPEQSTSFVGSSSTNGQIALDDVFGELRASLFLKIDVEGNELAVLKGASKILGTSNCKLIIETHSKQLEKSCEKLLENAGYTVQIIKNAWWRMLIPEQRNIPHNRWLVAFK